MEYKRKVIMHILGVVLVFSMEWATHVRRLIAAATELV